MNYRQRDGRLRPVILIGTGRCGSTLLHRILTRHPRLAWLSQLCEKHPEHPGLNARAMSLLDLPGMGPLLRRYLDPAEAYHLWEAIAPGFSEPDHDLTAADLRPGDRDRIRAVMAGMLTRSRDRLLIKITGWPRIGYLDAVFDRPHYVHVFRDGRAVAASLMNVSWWRGWRGPEEWRWGSLDPAQRDRWRRLDRSPAALAGIQWEILMDATEEAADRVSPDRYTRVRYEDLCESPAGEMRRIMSEAGLERSREIDAFVGNLPIRSANPGWRERMETEEGDRLEQGISPALQRYGFV